MGYHNPTFCFCGVLEPYDGSGFGVCGGEAGGFRMWWLGFGVHVCGVDGFRHSRIAAGFDVKRC